MTCEYCEESKIPGIHLPSDFDDRAPTKDGWVFVAKCDACGVYDSDVEAARVVSSRTGWPVQKSFDYLDAVDPKERAEKALAGYSRFYWRPYFAVTVKEAEAFRDKSVTPPVLAEFVTRLALLYKDEEIQENGKPFERTIDDAFETLELIISEARQLTVTPDRPLA